MKPKFFSLAFFSQPLSLSPRAVRSTSLRPLSPPRLIPQVRNKRTKKANMLHEEEEETTKEQRIRKREEEGAALASSTSPPFLPSPLQPPPSPATAAAAGRSPPNSILTLWNTESASAEYGASDDGISSSAGTAALCAATRWRMSLAARWVIRTTPTSFRARVYSRKAASIFGTGVSVVVVGVRVCGLQVFGNIEERVRGKKREKKKAKQKKTEDSLSVTMKKLDCLRRSTCPTPASRKTVTVSCC